MYDELTAEREKSISINMPGLMKDVYAWMAIALVVTGFSAWFVADNALLRGLFMGSRTGTLVLIVATFALVWRLSSAMGKMSLKTAAAMFLVYSVLMGMSLSFIFLAYTQSVIYQVFFISAAMFGVMALLGYTTKTDLTKLGSLLFMALIGIVIASLVNMFLRSPGFSYVISFIAVIVFTGLTAYDVQKLKQIGTQTEAGTEATAKLSIMGALTLYLDFINLFLALLRIFGGRRD